MLHVDRKGQNLSKPKILIQLDSDPQPSVFDAVVAVDSGAEQLFQHGNVSKDQVQGLVHGAMFTRGPKDLHNTAVFVGGSDVTLGEEMLKCVTDSFFGPIRVSVMMDASGANTTAAAAVVAAARHVNLAETSALVLAATGPVGQRVVRLLGGEGSQVKVASRKKERAQTVVDSVSASVADAKLNAVATGSESDLRAAMEGVDLVIAAGAAGIELLPEEVRTASSLKVAIDLNAVPPAGIGGVGVMDAAVEKDGQVLYGAIGVGGTKMKIHKAAIQRLFESNNVVMDIDEIYQLGRELE